MSENIFKVLLIAVCSEGMSELYEEIGICSIASYLREHGYQVMLMEVSEARVNYKKILEFGPDLIGMSVYDVSKNAVYRVIERLKSLLPEAKIFTGGTLPTYYHQEMLAENEWIDSAIRGEGELTTLELVQSLEAGTSLQGILGLTYRDGKEIIVNENRPLIEDLNMLPWPARDIMVENKAKVAMVSTSRGCLARCTFCTNQLFWKKWRGRDAKDIVDELEYLVNEYGITLFNFVDASFEDPDQECQRLISIAEMIIERGLEISYTADFRAEFYKKATDELMELLLRSGLCGVCVGIESANDQDLKLYGKNAKVEDNIQAIELFYRYNINILPGFINFNPYSTLEGLRKNITFLQKYRLAAAVDTLTKRYRMYKNTALYRKIEKDQLMQAGDYREDGYHFVDDKVATLADYLDQYVIRVNEEYEGAFARINVYMNQFFSFMIHMKKRLASSGQREQEIFQEFEDRYHELRQEINDQIANWYLKLLTLAEGEWDVATADSLSAECMEGNYVKKLAQGLDASVNKLYRNLLKQNPDYIDDFIKVI